MDELMEKQGRPPAHGWGARLRAVAPHLVVFGAALVLLLTALRAPRVLTADEVDTLRGGRHLVDLMTTPDHDPRLAWGDSVLGRLRAGFTPVDNPRLSVLPDSAPRRAVVEAPVPQWLAALGIGVLPVPADATNLDRARTAAALALALSVALLTWSRRKQGLLQIGFLAAGAFALPGFFDAGASAGYAAASMLVATLFLVTTQRLLDTGRGTFLVGVVTGLCLGVHPLHLVLLAVVFMAWAIQRRPVLPPLEAAEHPDTERVGLLRLPLAPMGLFVIPVVAIVVLILVWPALWNDTGKRLGAWIADFGTLKSPPVEVAGLTWDQAAYRTSQAWTALLQWIALMPWPLLVLWAIGLGRAIRRGRDGVWLPIVMLFTILLAAGLDGSLFGGRLSLFEALWAPTLLTSAVGFDALVGWVRQKATRWPDAARGPVLAWALGVVFLLLPIIHSARGNMFAAHLGLEARFGLPLALLHHAESIEPDASVHVRPMPVWYRPTLDAMRNDLESGLDWGAEKADLLITIGEPPADLSSRLGEELGRINGFGPGMTLWRLVPAASDERPTP